MKAEATIRRNVQRCRKFINSHGGRSDDPVTALRIDRAFATETALIWVMSKGNTYSAFDHVNCEYAEKSIHQFQKETRP